MSLTIFDRFRRNNSIESSTKNPKKIFFKLNIDEYGAYITVVNDKYKEVAVNYLNYSGAVRNVLRTIDKIQDKNAFVVNWEKSSDHIYLRDHDYLIWQLQSCDNFIDSQNNQLIFETGEASLKLHISHEETLGLQAQCSSKIVMSHNAVLHDDFHLITENHALVSGKIIPTKPLGNNFTELHHFVAEFHPKDLQKFFSLIFSYLDNVEVIYKDYSVRLTNDKVYAEPALVFEKIDVDDSLYMRITQVLPNTDPDFLGQLDLHRLAELNDLEKVIHVRYIEQIVVEDSLKDIQRRLNKHTPKKRKDEISEEVILDEDLFIVPQIIASNFVYKEVPKLLANYKVFGAEKLRDYKIAAIEPKIHLSLNHGIDFLEGDVNLDFEGELINIFDAITQYNKHNYILLNDGRHALVTENYIKRLQRIFKKKKNKVQVSFFDLPLVEELIEEKVAKEHFAKSRAIFEGFNNLGSKRPRLPKVKATLRPYQKEGYKWLKYLNETGLGGCLADDMGLGKTLQTITILAKYYPKEALPSLIVMPRSLLFNWEREVEKFAPQLKFHTYYGANRNLADALKANLIFTTYAIARNDIKQLKDQDFYYIILDESQNIKNTAAQTTKAIMLLQSRHRLALSGTPIENNLGELYSLFRFLNPSMFGTLQKFNENYATPIQKDNNLDVTKELRKKIYPFILRRLKKHVLHDLPDKMEQVLYVEMSAQQEKFYHQRRLFYQAAIKNQIAQKGMQQSKFFIFQALNELRQIASIPEIKSEGRIASTKLEMLSERLLETVTNGHKTLVFANFLSAIELISNTLDEHGIDFVSMTGSTRNRQRLVNRFQNDVNCRVFLMTLKTGGTGLNLTAADTVFIFDPWWNVAAETQAIDRAHRIGQTKKVMSYKLITQGTIEEKILQLQEAKKELFDNVISADGAGLKSMSEDDIDFILGQN